MIVDSENKMTYPFGQSFYLISANADILPVSPSPSYWDGGTIGNIVAIPPVGRFPGSQGISFGAAISVFNNSGTNDAVHHINISINHLVVFAGASNYHGFTLCMALQPNVQFVLVVMSRSCSCLVVMGLF